MMKLNINVPEVRNFIKDLAKKPGDFLEMIHYNVQETVGKSIIRLL